MEVRRSLILVTLILGTLLGGKGTIFGGPLSPDGKFCLCGDGWGNLTLWDVAAGKEIRTFGRQETATSRPGRRPYFRDVTFCPDGKQALSAGYDGLVRLWDVTCGKQIRVFEGHN